jgi:hypothetical protein
MGLLSSNMVGSRAAVSQTFKSACSEPSHPFMDSPRGYPEFSSYKRRHLPFVDDSTHNERTAVKASPCVGMEPHDCVPSRQDDLRKTTVERFRMHVCVCEGFRMTAHRDGSACTGAVVRKPPVKERAGDGVPTVTRALWRFDRGGDGGRKTRERGRQKMACAGGSRARLSRDEDGFRGRLPC